MRKLFPLFAAWCALSPHVPVYGQSITERKVPVDFAQVQNQVDQQEVVVAPPPREIPVIDLAQVGCGRTSDGNGLQPGKIGVATVTCDPGLDGVIASGLVNNVNFQNSLATEVGNCKPTDRSPSGTPTAFSCDCPIRTPLRCEYSSPGSTAVTAYLKQCKDANKDPDLTYLPIFVQGGQETTLCENVLYPFGRGPPDPPPFTLTMQYGSNDPQFASMLAAWASLAQGPGNPDQIFTNGCVYIDRTPPAQIGQALDSLCLNSVTSNPAGGLRYVNVPCCWYDKNR